MNQKGEITFLTLLVVSILSSILAVAVYDVGKNCRFYCKLDLNYIDPTANIGLQKPDSILVVKK